MKKIALALLAFILCNAAIAQKKYRNIDEAAEAFRMALIQADITALDKLTADSLTYGHSSGKIQNKTEFLESLQSGKSDFVTIDISGQHINSYGNTAVIRHTLSATTNDSGNPGTVKLLILLVWKKMHGGWKLITRQAVKPPM